MSPQRDRPRREQALAVLLVPVVMLAVIFTGVIVLENTAPQGDPRPELRVEGIATPALGGQPTRCVRSSAEDRVLEVRAQVLEGDRITSDLVNACPAAFEDIELTYVGEVIGHVLERGDHAWVQVNDDDYALRDGPLPDHQRFSGTNTSLAVRLTRDHVEQLTGLGGPGRRGDVVLLTGMVVRTDPDDGGGLTFRARDLTVLAPSVELDQPLHVPQAVAAVLMTLVAGGVALGLRRSRRQRR